MVKERIVREHGAMSRQKVKRKLLDELDAKHKFTPPPSLVEDEFTNVWKTIRTTCRLASAPSRKRARPRKRPRKNTAASPSGACGSVW
jgi:FKBP-type peptidyl-prolyl cis-trans isomerase (trigger factor)